MVISWYGERYRLYKLKQDHPLWSKKKLADQMGRSYSWVKKWSGRLEGVKTEADETIFRGENRGPKEPTKKVGEAVVKEILRLRDQPGDVGMGRLLGPKAIQYFLTKAEALKELKVYIPRSATTIWQILRDNDRIIKPSAKEYEPLNRNEPLQEWEIDFKDVTTIKEPLKGKVMHQIETLNIIDTGTSILVDNSARFDFNAETVIDSLIECWSREGLPKVIRFDRDPRFIGSWTADDFPSPLMKLMLNLGIEPDICPPQSPWLNCYVERYNRTYKYEGIYIYFPENLAETQAMNQDFKHHYNYRRPNQALTCDNQPPRLAFPDLPSLPPLPDFIQPNQWLNWTDGKRFKRRVNSNGSVKIGKYAYYIKRTCASQLVSLKVNASERLFEVWLDQKVIKTIPLKGLEQDGLIHINDYLLLIKAEARSEWQQLKRKFSYKPL